MQKCIRLIVNRICFCIRNFDVHIGHLRTVPWAFLSQIIFSGTMARKLYPIGIQTFEEIRKKDFFYVDKTAYVYQMTHTMNFSLKDGVNRLEWEMGERVRF